MVNPSELTREDHTLRTAIRMAEVVASLAKLVDVLVEEGVRRIAAFSLKPHEWGVKRLLHTRSVVVRLQHPAKMDDQKHDDNQDNGGHRLVRARLVRVPFHIEAPHVHRPEASLPHILLYITCPVVHRLPYCIQACRPALSSYFR